MLSKVIEKVVLEQTTNFLTDNNIFYKYQSGFRNNHSKDLFLSFLNDKILKGFDNGVYTGMILIDLQKAFDTVNDKILLDKLLPIGSISCGSVYNGEIKKKIVSRSIEHQQESIKGNWSSSGAIEHTKECHDHFDWLHPETLSLKIGIMIEN